VVASRMYSSAYRITLGFLKDPFAANALSEVDSIATSCDEK
jgi:hypothetical protein